MSVCVLFYYFASNPPTHVNCCVTGGCGNCFTVILDSMKEDNNRTGYLPAGTPIDYVDDKGIRWFYHGKGEDGSDNWYGIPVEK